MKILNLYAGIGGNRKLWGDEHDITAVEINDEVAKVYSDNFPKDSVVIGDAHKYLIESYNNFDFIWSSPPCQSHSQMVKATRHDVRKYPDMSLYQEIILLKEMFDGKWVVENVNPYYEPLIKPSKKIGRHLIWSNFIIGNVEIPKMPNFIQADSKREIQKFKKWLGIKYSGNIYMNGNHSPGQVLRNCVHPKLGKHILDRAQDIIVKSDTEQTMLEL